MGQYDGATGFKPITRIDRAAILDPKTLKVVKKGSLTTGQHKWYHNLLSKKVGSFRNQGLTT